MLTIDEVLCGGGDASSICTVIIAVAAAAAAGHDETITIMRANGHTNGL